MKTNELPRWATAFALPALNLLSALLAAALVIYLLGEDPAEALRILINSAIINPEGLSYTLFYASTFIFTGLSVSIAMKAGLFNIGSEGQMYLGGLGLTVVMLSFDQSLSAWTLISPSLCSARPSLARRGPGCRAICKHAAAATSSSRRSCSTLSRLA